MTSYTPTMTGAVRPDSDSYKTRTGRLCHSLSGRFHRLVQRYAIFHLIFALLMMGEAATLVGLLFNFAQSSVLAVALATLFLTAFTYFVARLYLQAKKPDQMIALRDLYVESCRSLLGYQEGVSEHHLALANATCKLASSLQDQEHEYYQAPRLLAPLKPLLSKLSCLLHWRDLLSMRELLLHFAIDEYVKLVKCEPTTLEIHAALANAYVMLAALYADPRRVEGYDQWVPPGRYNEEMQTRFQTTADRAVEELRILGAFAPDNPWVHAQLAYSYHDLQMAEEEIAEYETIVQLQPDDLKTLFKLGMRYFQQGQNAQGLQVYQELKRRHYPKADELMRFYGIALPTPLVYDR